MTEHHQLSRTSYRYWRLLICLFLAISGYGGNCSCDRDAGDQAILEGITGNTAQRERAKAGLVVVIRQLVAVPSADEDAGVPDGGVDLETVDGKVELRSAQWVSERAYGMCKKMLREGGGGAQTFSIFDSALGLEFPHDDHGYLPGQPQPLILAPNPPTCKQAVATVQVSLCTADALIEMASSGLPFVGLRDGQDALSVPPQQTEASARLAEMALHWSQIAAVFAGENIRKLTGIYDDLNVDSSRVSSLDQSGHRRLLGSCVNSGTSEADYLASTFIADDDGTPITDAGHTMTYGDAIFDGIAEAITKAEEAGRLIREFHLAVADSEFSKQGVADAARFAWVDPLYSRAYAARILLGGDLLAPILGLPPGEGYCARSEGSVGSTEALKLIRASALNPALVLDTRILTESSTYARQLFSSNSLSCDDGGACFNIRQRLAALYQSEMIDSQSFEEFLDSRGLSEQEFIGALLTLRDQIVAFSPSLTTELPRTSLSAAETAVSEIHPSLIPRYTATAQPPSKPPAIHHIASIVQGGTPPDHQYDVPLRSNTSDFSRSDWITTDYARSSLAALLDYSYSIISVASTDTNVEEAQRALALRQTMLARRELPRRLAVASEYTSAGIRIQIDVHGASGIGASDDPTFMIVQDVDDLKCALEGMIDGSPCTFAGVGNVSGPYSPPRWSGYERAVRVVHTDTDVSLSGDRYLPRTATGARTYYVLEKVDHEGPSGPGAWKAVGAYTTHGVSAGESMLTFVPYVEDLYSAVAKLAVPSARHCPRPQISCTGLPDGQRIALENELSEDYNGVETSWRIYLDLAEQAAAEADFLGDQMVSAGLEIEQRVELATDELEQLCGGPLNLSSYVEGIFAGGLDIPSTSGCEPGERNTSGEVCVHGKFLADPLEKAVADAPHDASAQKVAACLEADQSVDYLGLGDQKLCIWVNDKTGRLCEHSDTVEGGCPSPAPAHGCDGMDLPVAAGEHGGALVPVHVENTLSLIKDSIDSDTNNGGTANLIRSCEVLREARINNSISDADLQLLKKSFTLEVIKSYARAISWRGKPFDHSELIYDSAPIASTGSNVGESHRSVVNGWPCGYTFLELKEGFLTGTPGCSGSGNSNALSCHFIPEGVCNAYDKTSRQTRARMNHRIGNAALALSLLTGGELFDFRLPHMELKSSKTWETQSGGNGDAVSYSLSEYESLRGIRMHGVRFLNCSGNRSSCAFNSEHEHEGEAYCLDYPRDDDRRSMWHGVRRDGSTFEVLAGCQKKKENEYPRQRPLVFKKYGELVTPDTASALNKIWAGMGTSVRMDGHDATIAKALESLRLSGGDEMVAISRSSDLAKELSEYWIADSTEQNRASPHSEFYKDWDRLALLYSGITNGQILDALELACSVAALDGEASCGAVSDVASINDLEDARRFIQCQANAVEEAARSLVFANVPQEVIRALTDATGQYGQGTLSGERGAAIQSMVSAIENFRYVPLRLKRALDGFVYTFERFEIDLEEQGLNSDLRTMNFRSQMASLAIQAASTLTGILKLDFGSVASAAQAATAMTQAILQNRIEAKIEGLQKERAFLDFTDRVKHLSAEFDTIDLELKMLSADLAASLTALETSRQQGVRALSKASLAATDASGRSLGLNTVLQRRYTTTQVRYQRARRTAISLAELARIALEQRLGVRLAVMREDLTLVEAPQKWEASLCRSSGMSYAGIRDALAADYALGHYAEDYVGDYVKKLRLVAESYRLDYPFQEGTDTAVVSVRNDILESRDWCLAPSRNLLGGSSDLGLVSVPTAFDEGGISEKIWVASECEPVEWIDPETGEVTSSTWPCVSRALIPAEGLDYGTWSGRPFDPSANGPLNAWRVGFDVLTPAEQGYRCETSPAVLDEEAYFSDYGCRCTTSSCDECASTRASVLGEGCVPSSYTDESHLAQEVWINEPGIYALSWYGRWVAEDEGGGLSGSPIHPAAAVSVRNEWGGLLPFTLGSHDVAVGAGAPGVSMVAETAPSLADLAFWQRYYGLVHVAQPGWYRVEIAPVNGMPIDVDAPVAVDLAGFMLERSQYGGMPGPYLETVYPGLSSLPVCEDIEGTQFRRRFARRCVKICPTGVGEFCADVSAEERCFFEMMFSVTADDLATGRLLGRTGFAAGNYNYRTEQIAVNLVGVGLKDCSRADWPSSCFSNASIPFSLRHLGPYEVTAHNGAVYHAPLFNGAIEYGRGLSAERYLTNPLSSSDKALLDGYSHREFIGRPVAGTYALRIWDTPELRLENLEDVQILLSYRYWTRSR